MTSYRDGSRVEFECDDCLDHKLFDEISDRDDWNEAIADLKLEGWHFTSDGNGGYFHYCSACWVKRIKKTAEGLR